MNEAQFCDHSRWQEAEAENATLRAQLEEAEATMALYQRTIDGLRNPTSSAVPYVEVSWNSPDVTLSNEGGGDGA